MTLRSTCITGVLLVCLVAAAFGEVTWQKGGVVSVNGKTLAGAVYLKSGRSLVFPVVALAEALGHKATADAAGTVTYDGKTFKTPSLVVVDGVAYLGWRDLSRIEPALEYGVSGDRAVFALGPRRTSMPTGGAEAAPAGEARWLEDFGAAKAQAASQGKRILLDFTGSDWCGWCKKLDAEVFSTPEFKAYAARNLILVKVDFPHGIAQSDSLKKQNAQLQATYGIQGYPTIVILSPDGRQVGETGYKPGGPASYIRDLEGMK